MHLLPILSWKAVAWLHEHHCGHKPDVLRQGAICCDEVTCLVANRKVLWSPLQTSWAMPSYLEAEQELAPAESRGIGSKFRTDLCCMLHC